MEYRTQSKNRIILQKPSEWHHHQIILYLAMFGSAVLFLFITIAFFATRSIDDTLSLSKYFSYSTVILLLSSYPIARLGIAYDGERGKQIIKGLGTSIFSGSIFTLLQIAGWYEIQDQTAQLSSRSLDFLYLLSGLHILHVVVIVVLTTFIMYRITLKLSDPVKSLMYYTNPYQRLILKMLSHSWVFLHMIWVFIYLVFVTFNS